jgi:hypothetical protein
MAANGGVQGNGSAPPAQLAQFRADGINANTGLRLPFLSEGFSRAFGFPDVRIINMITEAAPLREERPYVAFVGVREIRYSRPGLVTGLNLGAGPIRGVYFAPGSPIGNKLLVVSGTTIYLNGVSVGTLPGSDLVRFAASPLQVVAIASGGAYVYDGSTYASFTLIQNGTLPFVSDAAYLGGRFVYVAPGSSTWWYSELNDAANVNGLDFASNENSPADNLAVGIINDQVAFFTQNQVEFWSVTTDPTAPFSPNIGTGYQRGIASRDTLVFADNTLFWVGDNGVVYRSANAPDRISNSSIEDKIRQCANWGALSAFRATFEGHEFYVLNVPGVGSYAYDISRIGTAEGAYGDSYSRGEWSEWASWNHPQFRCRVAAQLGPTVYAGDDTTNDVWLMQVGAYSDAGGPMTRQACAFIKVEEGQPRCDGLVCHGVMGVGNASAPSPIVEMRYSDDLGRTFSPWRAGSLGPQGAYQTRARWTRLGLMRAPGRLVQVRCSDPVDVAFSHLELNPLRPAA